MESLCKVLGSKFQEKSDELGIAPDEEMDEKTNKALERTIGLLEDAKESRFSKLQALGLKLRDLWKFHNTAPENILEFAETFACIDAKSANELTNEKSLSVELISKATEEIKILEASMVAKQKKIYLGKKQKLLKLLEETRMAPSDVKFDPKKQVKSDFPKATSDLKILIKQAKEQILQRKDIVMRIELLQHAGNNSLSVETSERLLGSLKNLVLLEETFLFDGKDVKVVINDIEDVIRPASAKGVLPLKKRISSRLSELRDKENAELPSPPYPSRVRAGKDVKVVINEIEDEMRPASAKAVLPLKKRISSRLSELRNKENAELPSPPYPSRVRAGKDVKVVTNEIEDKMKPASAKAALPLKKKISSRLSESRNKENAELPPPPYPSRVRDGNRERRKGVWGKETKW